MTVLVIAYTPSGKIVDWRYEADDGYETDEGEFIPDPEPDHRDLEYKRVDLSGSEPALVDDPPGDWELERVVDERTFDIITEQFLAAGANALTADTAIQANTNIPQEVKDMNRATIQMFYLLYVSLTGDRIDAVEADYFPVM